MPTFIEWVLNPDGTRGITVNSKTGCLNHINGMCKGGGFPCYAYRLANTRLKEKYLTNLDIAIQPETMGNPFRDPFFPRFWPERLEQIRKRKKPTGIFLDDMSDWMGDYWPEAWTEQEIRVMRDCPQHRFYTLTKQPQNLPQWSPFPPNCFVGVSVTRNSQLEDALIYLQQIEAAVKFISFEPLLDKIISWVGDAEYLLKDLDWLIIGALTGTMEELLPLHHKASLAMVRLNGNRWSLQPKIEWIDEIVEAADKAGIPVFLKDNLKPLLEMQDITGTNFGRLTSLTVEAIKDIQGLPRQRGWYELRQELPGN